jgi:hypothetical protein
MTLAPTAAELDFKLSAVLRRSEQPINKLNASNDD